MKFYLFALGLFVGVSCNRSPQKGLEGQQSPPPTAGGMATSSAPGPLTPVDPYSFGGGVQGAGGGAGPGIAAKAKAKEVAGQVSGMEDGE